MPKLKLGAIPDDKPIRLTVTVTAELHALLIKYADVHSREFDRKVPPEKLVPHMLERFIRTDRAFAKAQRTRPGLHAQSRSAGETERPE